MSGALSRTPGEDSSNYAINQGTLSAGNNYTIRYTSADFTINRKKLTVTAKPKTIVYGEAPANDGVTYSGFANGDDAGKLSGTLSYTYDYQQYGDVGTYQITPGGLTSSNYEITFQPGILTVNQKPVTFRWTGDSFAYNGKERSVTAEVSNVVNGDKLTVTTADAAKTDAGGYTAKATAIGGDKAKNYVLKADEATASHDWSITKADNAVKVSLDGWTYGKTAKTPAAAATFGADTATFTYSDKADGTYTDQVPAQAGTWYLKAAVPGTANYKAAESKPVSFEIARASITIAADNKSSKYKSALEELTYTVSGDYVDGDDLGVTLSTTASKTAKVGGIPSR
jgi:hypothetical protein